MPLTKNDREIVELAETVYPRRDSIEARVIRILRRLDAESRRQRRAVAYLKRRLRVWMGE